jgi:hypothetical protein
MKFFDETTYGDRLAELRPVVQFEHWHECVRITFLVPDTETESLCDVHHGDREFFFVQEHPDFA